MVVAVTGWPRERVLALARRAARFGGQASRRLEVLSWIVLAGALQEPDMVGPGTLTFDHAAVHEMDSSWDVFRLLAIGVARVLSLPSEDRIPENLLPRFGGYQPASPGAD